MDNIKKADAPVYVIDASNEYVVSAARKIAQEYRHGAVIALSAEEFRAWQTHSRRVDL